MTALTPLQRAALSLALEHHWPVWLEDARGRRVQLSPGQPGRRLVLTLTADPTRSYIDA